VVTILGDPSKLQIPNLQKKHERVLFEREKSNPKDSNAIMVKRTGVNGDVIGYVMRHHAKYLCVFMDDKNYTVSGQIQSNTVPLSAAIVVGLACDSFVEGAENDSD